MLCAAEVPEEVAQSLFLCTKGNQILWLDGVQVVQVIKIISGECKHMLVPAQSICIQSRQISTSAIVTFSCVFAPFIMIEEHRMSQFDDNVSNSF